MYPSKLSDADRHGVTRADKADSGRLQTGKSSIAILRAPDGAAVMAKTNKVIIDVGSGQQASGFESIGVNKGLEGGANLAVGTVNSIESAVPKATATDHCEDRTTGVVEADDGSLEIASRFAALVNAFFRMLKTGAGLNFCEVAV